LNRRHAVQGPERDGDISGLGKAQDRRCKKLFKIGLTRARQFETVRPHTEIKIQL
jgi:hypothetical protein